MGVIARVVRGYTFISRYYIPATPSMWWVSAGARTPREPWVG
jgi:hypothetical protein